MADTSLAGALVESHAAFPNLAALLSYLHMCVTATSIDVTRAQAVQARTARSLAAHESTEPEQALLDQVEYAELWRLVNNLITTEQERVILVERYVLDLPPRRILARHQTLFADVRAIYSAVRHLCCRLGRHRDLRQLWDDRIAA